MSHLVAIPLAPEPCGSGSKNDIGNANARVDRAMSLRAAHALAALLLEHANLRSARFAFDDRFHAGVGDERRAGRDFAAVFFDEQHLLERELGARFAGRSVE